MPTYENIPVAVQNTPTVDLPIVISAGSYNAVLKYKGKDYFYTVLSSGTVVTIKNDLQANTTHTLTILSAIGTPLGDTVYLITTDRVQNTTANNIYKFSTVTTDGQTTLQNGVFVGASNIDVFLEGDYQYSITHSTSDDFISFPIPLGDRQRMDVIVTR